MYSKFRGNTKTIKWSSQQHCEDKHRKQIETLTIIINNYYLVIILKSNIPKPKSKSKANQLKYQNLKHILLANFKIITEKFNSNV